MKIKKLRDAARDAPCMACGAMDGTIVAAHRNEFGGMGMKTTDVWVSYLCGKCHYELDNGKEMTREERRTFWLRAYANTVRYWFNHGIVKPT